MYLTLVGERCFAPIMTSKIVNVRDSAIYSSAWRGSPTVFMLGGLRMLGNVVANALVSFSKRGQS
jgi:hypothetical protein